MSNSKLKYPALLLLMLLLIIIAGSLLDDNYSFAFSFLDLFNLSLSFAITAMISMLVFIRGIKEEPGRRAMHTLTATGIKFVAGLFIALVWFAVAKKNEPECIILFLLLYLAFSLFLMFVIIKTLKNNSL